MPRGWTTVEADGTFHIGRRRHQIPEEFSDRQVHSFRTLLTHLSTIVRNKCRRWGSESEEPTFYVDTSPDAKQRKAYDLLRTINVYP